MATSPTAGFSLSALPTSINVKDQLGMDYSPNIRAGFTGGLKSYQDARLVGPQTNAQVALADYQRGKALQLQSLLDPEQKSLLQGLEKDRLEALVASEKATGVIPYARSTTGTQAQNLLTTAQQEGIVLGARGEVLPERSKADAQTDLENSRRQLALATMFRSAYAPAPASAPAQPSVAPGALSPAPSVPPVTATQPATIKPKNLVTGKPLSSLEYNSAGLIPPVETGIMSQGNQTVQQSGEVAPAPSNQLEAAPAIQSAPQTAAALPAQEMRAEQGAQLPSEWKQTPEGGMQYKGVVIPKQMAENQIFKGYIQDGFTPVGDFYNWKRQDWKDLKEYTIKIDKATGLPETTIKDMPANQVAQIGSARIATSIARQMDPTYSPSGTPPEILDSAEKIINKRTIQSPNQKFSALNPAANLGAEPSKAAEVLNKAQADGNFVIGNLASMDQKMNSLRGHFNEFKTLNSRVATGGLQAKLVDSFLGGVVGAQEFINTFNGTKEERSLLQQNVADLQRMAILHNQIIPQAIRNNANTVNSMKGSSSGGPSGLGRIMQNELGWIASDSPSTNLLMSTNIGIIDDALIRMDAIRDQINYTRQFYNDFNSIEGSGENFLKYSNANPYLNDNGSINNNRQSWQSYLMSEEWNRANPNENQPTRYGETAAPSDNQALRQSRQTAFAAYKAAGIPQSEWVNRFKSESAAKKP
jgi:hypothetical protein